MLIKLSRGVLQLHKVQHELQAQCIAHSYAVIAETRENQMVKSKSFDELRCGNVHTLTRLNVLPILSDMVFFFRCRLHTAKQALIASDALTMCSCSKVRTASRNRNTQFPMEWYMDDLHLNRFECCKNQRCIWAMFCSASRGLTMVSLGPLLRQIYYWKNNRRPILLQPGMLPSPRHRPFNRKEEIEWHMKVNMQHKALSIAPFPNKCSAVVFIRIRLFMIVNTFSRHLNVLCKCFAEEDRIMNYDGKFECKKAEMMKMNI